MSSLDASELVRWSSALAFSRDESGGEQLLDANGTQVMMEWERPYMARCIDKLCITSSCNVLEVGFGCAYSADRIQLAKPRSHTIVECSDPVLERLRAWAHGRPNVHIIEGTWQARLPELGHFDKIFFDDFGAAGMSEAEMLNCCPHAEYRAEYVRARTHFHAFINICLRWHMRPGAKMSGYLVQPISLNRSDASLSLERMPVRPAPSCHYFNDKVAIVPCIEKHGSDDPTTCVNSGAGAEADANDLPKHDKKRAKASTLAPAASLMRGEGEC